MHHRQSMSNGYQIPPGMKLVPASSQQEPIPIMTGPGQPFQPIPMLPQYKSSPTAYNNASRHNRVAPPPSQDYNNSFRTQSSMNSTKPPIPTSQMYRNQKQPSVVNANYANHPNQSYGSYNQQNNHMNGSPPVDDLESEKQPTSWFSKPLCLGLTRFSGGILFGTMTFLGIASISGLIVSIVLYVNDVTTDPQWKILGMVVCSILLLTVIVTLCIFIYCYKHGHIVDNNKSLSPQHTDGNEYPNSNSLKPYGYNQPYDKSSIPYGRMQNGSPLSTNEDIIQVDDKLTNTETTRAPLRPRDFKRGAWPAVNQYGGLTQRPSVPPKMASRFIQVLPNEIDRAVPQGMMQASNVVPRTVFQRPGSRIEYVGEQGPPPRRMIEQPQHQIVEEIILRPRRQSQGYVEIIEEPKRGGEQIAKGPGSKRFNQVSVKHVRKIEEPNDVDDDYNTDHFYQ